MLDGIDWVRDHDWLVALFLKTEIRHANRILTFNYPHFRTPRVVQSFSSDD